MNKFKKYYGFTLVELIIVITILAILSTVAFVSFQGYTRDTRDTSRLSDLNQISKGLESFFVVSGTYPMPENYITIVNTGVTIGYQGYFGDSDGKIIKINKTPVDPTDSNQYTYLVNTKTNKYELLGFLENNNITLNDINLNTYASSSDYSNRNIKTIGDQMGILLLNTGSDINRPLQEKYDVNTFTGIDIYSYTGTVGGNSFGELKAVFSKNNSVTGSGTIIRRLANIYRGAVQMPIVAGEGNSNCPNGWSDIGIFKGGSLSAIYTGATNTSIKICETTTTNYISKGSIITLITNSGTFTCPDGWNDKGTLRIGTTTTPNKYFKGCEAGSDLYIPTSSQVMMVDCPVGYNYIGINKFGTTIPTAPSICEKQ